MTDRGVDLDLDVTAVRCRGERVVDEVVDDLLDRAGNGRGERLLTRANRQIDALLLGQWLPDVGALASECCQIDHAGGLGASVGSCESEQSVDEVLEPLRLGAGRLDPHSGAARIGVDHVCGLVQSKSQRGERRPQLVRSITGEGPLLVDQMLDPRRHRVEGSGEAANLWWSLVGGRGHDQVAVCQSFCRSP